MADLYGGTLRLDPRAILADGGHGVVVTAERGSYRGEDLAYTSAHLFTFDDEGKCREFLALQDDAYHAFWARHASSHPGNE